MTDTGKSFVDKTQHASVERDDRKFFVSANRGRASHRIRYVESGGAAVDNEECTFCQAVPVASDAEEERS
ncbi:hypothetical protein FWJ25_07290 [Marinobacter salinexigens]|uniref:Uncharacterized protein n=1 Tax=Marinobacter salinexigens TaxID=2919747 RepID=A0A5B0VL34_9GAMM|nr:hypothetical protein [Marinobacter salinexigens]KAA1175164.1 hypothetical protein FWJ25_07290 [Marinobacter salinexigens]